MDPTLFEPSPSANCWIPCFNRAGRCPHFCGAGRACCKNGRFDPLPCPSRTSTYSYHTCVKSDSDDRSFDENDLIRAHEFAAVGHPGIHRKGTTHFIHGSRTWNRSSHIAWCLGECSKDTVVAPRGGAILMGSSEIEDALRLLLKWSDGGDILVIRTHAPAAIANEHLHGLIAQLGFASSVSTVLLRTRAATEDKLVLSLVDRADALLFVGGSGQWEHLREWRNTSFLRQLQAAIARGVPVGGTWSSCDLESGCSSAQLGRKESAPVTSSPGASSSPPLLRLRPAGVFDSVAFDSHVRSRDQMSRLLLLTAQRWRSGGRAIGVGVEGHTAFAIDAAGGAKLLGQGLDGGRAYVLEPVSGPNLCCDAHALEWRDVPVQKLDAHRGDTYDLPARRGGTSSQRYNISMAGGQLLTRDPYHPPWRAGFVSTGLRAGATTEGH